MRLVCCQAPAEIEYFGVDTNVVTILTDREVLELPLMGKDQVAARLLDEIRKRRDA